ncbi:hypothetical protein TNCV_569681 [Trichonephila clavipes]|nr:hypothetical protein TNCV_569681 [Trichonephila clavipes]
MLNHLEDNIRRVLADIRPQMLEKVIENWTSRLDYIRASRGSPMPEIIFKMYLDAWNHRMFTDLCEYESLRGNRRSEGVTRTSSIEQNVLDTLQSNPSTSVRAVGGSWSSVCSGITYISQ